jgi:NAD(P)-dependent dehydrogenase (short-subunit alcohol dehydrogenase family)
MESPDAAVAVVTGAGRGIGRAAAVALAQVGYRVALVSRTETELHETARMLRDEWLVIRADVSIPETCEGLIHRVEQHFGRIDAIVHCAGVAPARAVEQTTPLLWREVLDTNLSAAFYLARAVWPMFRKRAGGVIVNVSSFAARDPYAGFAAYGAAKAGVNLLGLSLAREGAPLGIRVHTVAPAAVETRMFRQILTKEQFSAEKTLKPEEVAEVIVHCVRGTLRYTSGEVIWMKKD